MENRYCLKYEYHWNTPLCSEKIFKSILNNLKLPGFLVVFFAAPWRRWPPHPQDARRDRHLRIDSGDVGETQMRSRHVSTRVRSVTRLVVWYQHFCTLFNPETLGKMIQLFDEHIFQMGWLKPPISKGFLQWFLHWFVPGSSSLIFSWFIGLRREMDLFCWFIWDHAKRQLMRSLVFVMIHLLFAVGWIVSVLHLSHSNFSKKYKTCFDMCLCPKRRGARTLGQETNWFSASAYSNWM